jgi:hypothetical protein
MSEVIKKKPARKLRGNGTISDKVKSYENEPFFIKKAEEAAETLKRVGLPGDRK